MLLSESWTNLKKTSASLLSKATNKGSAHFSKAAVSKLDIARQFAGLFSILTLHLLFFFLQFDYALWPVIDIGLIANVTFSFGLLAALSVLALRVTKPIIGFVYGCSVFAWLGIVGWARSFQKHRKGLRYQETTAEIFIRTVIQKEDWLGRIFALLLLPLAIFPIPNEAGIRLGSLKIHVAFERYGWLRDPISYLVGVLVFCFFYTGFKFIFTITILLYLTIFLSAFLLAVEHKISTRQIFSLLKSCRSPTYLIQELGALDPAVKSSLLGMFVIFMSLLSGLSGEARYNYLAANNATVMTEIDSDDLLTYSQIGNTSQGIIFWDPEDEKQYFYPFSSIKKIETIDINKATRN